MGKNQRERKLRRIEEAKQIKEEVQKRKSQKDFWAKFWVRPAFWIYAACILALAAYPFVGQAIAVQQSKSHDEAILHTSMGDIGIKLYNFDSPKSVDNFVKLSQRGYYNGLLFHRVIKSFMIQTGDPNGDGTGGESAWGGTFDDEINAYDLGLDQTKVGDAAFLKGGQYSDEQLNAAANQSVMQFFQSEGYKYSTDYHTRKITTGTVAYANRGPNTNGSQFFIVTGGDQPHLDGKYTPFGEVVSGMDIAQQISETNVDENDKPTSPITILSIEIK